MHVSSVQVEGLVTALKTRIEAVEERTGISVEFQADDLEPMSATVEEALYNIAREALNNILRHAQASNVAIRLVQNDSLVKLEIQDDGVGFDPSIKSRPGRLGLKGMEEKVSQMGGSLIVSSKPGEGTTIRMEMRI